MTVANCEKVFENLEDSAACVDVSAVDGVAFVLQLPRLPGSGELVLVPRVVRTV